MSMFIPSTSKVDARAVGHESIQEKQGKAL